MSLRDLLGCPVQTISSSMPAITRTQLTVIVLIVALVIPTSVESFGVCRSSFRCLNGGEERYGQSIFGPCRCRCRPGYTGPRCQYREVTRKRSSSLNVLNDFLQARMRAEREEQERQRRLLQEEEGFVSVDQDPLERRRRDSTVFYR